MKIGRILQKTSNFIDRTNPLNRMSPRQTKIFIAVGLSIITAAEAVDLTAGKKELQRLKNLSKDYYTPQKLAMMNDSINKKSSFFMQNIRRATSWDIELAKKVGHRL